MYQKRKTIVEAESDWLGSLSWTLVESELIAAVHNIETPVVRLGSSFPNKVVAEQKDGDQCC